MGAYTTLFHGTTLYIREYAGGYVIVNPSNTNSASFSLPEPCKEMTYSNYTNVGAAPNVTSTSVARQRARIFFKASVFV